MKRLLTIYAMTAAITLAQKAQPFTGTIAGFLRGEDGSSIEGGTVDLQLASPIRSRYDLQSTSWTAMSGKGGAFQFTALPAGSYRFCAQVRNSTWLNPCEWNLALTTPVISPVVPNTNVTITLKRGAAVPVHVDDTGQLMAQHDGKTPGAGLLLNVAGPGLFLRLVPIVTKNTNARDYRIVVPFNTKLTLVVHPSYYRLSDARGAVVSNVQAARIPLLIAAGQQVAPITFTVTGTAN